MHAILFITKMKIPDTDITLKVGENKNEFTDHTKRLGMSLDSKLTWNKHIDAKAKQAKIYINQLQTSNSKSWGPSPEKIIWIWSAVVRVGLLAIRYASYVWSTKLKKTQREKWNKIRRIALVQLGNFWFTTPKARLNVGMGQLLTVTAL